MDNLRIRFAARVIRGLRVPPITGAVLATVLALAVPAQADASASLGRQAAPLRIPLGVAERQIGFTVALSGATAVAGAPGWPLPGLVYVELRSGSTWHHQQTLTDPHQNEGGGFGTSVAVSAGSRNGPATLLIGDPPGASSAGRVYIYARSNGTWHRQATLTDPGGGSDSFGASVALSGDTALVGAGGAGLAYVYVRSGTRWHLQATLADPRHTPNGYFGSLVSLSGSTAAIANGALYPAAYVFVRSRTSWHVQARLPLGGYENVITGLGVLGSTVVMGGPGTNAEVRGVADIFARSGSAWRLQAKITDPQHGFPWKFGSGVALSRTADGLRMLAGNPSAGANYCGKVYDFARTNSRWRDKAVIINPACQQDAAYASSAEFGAAIAAVGQGAIIGAPGSRNGVGAWYALNIP